MCKEGVDHEHPEGDKGLVIHSRCHMGSPTWVSYKHGENKVDVLCAVCESLIASIYVGHGPN
jgi:hypothetical protein